MKKLLPLVFLFSCLIFSCTFEKGNVMPLVPECVDDTIIHKDTITINDVGAGGSFSPSNLEIMEGDTVVWYYPSSGTSGHTSTCDGTGGTSKPAGSAGWDSGSSSPILPGGSFSTTISAPGNYTYICSYHSGMTGTIVVKPRCQ
jgi:plastocyanin